MKTQERYTIDIQPLFVRKAGFHKFSIEIVATTEKTSREVWFFTSDDFKKLRYVEFTPIKTYFKLILSYFIKRKLVIRTISSSDSE